MYYIMRSRAIRRFGNPTMRDVKVSEVIGHSLTTTLCRNANVRRKQNTATTVRILHSPVSYHFGRPLILSIAIQIIVAMPQYHTATGTVSYPDAKSSFPKFPQVGFGRAVAIGIGAGFVGALV